MIGPVDEPWRQKVVALMHRLGRDPTLDELLALAKDHKEIEAQRQSWARQMKD